MAGPEAFDPLAVIAALEGAYVDYVLIGGLAQVLRGADVWTGSVDICPSFAAGNIQRLAKAVETLGVGERSRKRLELSEQALAAQPILRLSTSAGQLGIAGSPAGVPNGFIELRRAASHEDLGNGMRPLVAGTADLAAMAAALGREQDKERLRMLRRIVELEATRPPSAGRSTAAPAARRSRAVRDAPHTTR